MKFMEEAGHPVIFDLADNKELHQNLHQLIDKKYENAEEAVKERALHIVDAAYTNVSHAVRQLNAAKEEILAGKKQTHETPIFYMSMGGGGAGKSSVEEMMKAACGGKENFVVASLDEFRKKSDLYQLLQAAGHHRDDYRLVEQPINALRQWVTDAACAKKINVLFDGTGIPFRGENGKKSTYEKLVDTFAQNGYITRIGAVETSLENAAERVAKRAEEEGRNLPIQVVLKKHQKMPESVMDGAFYAAVEKLSLFCNDVERGTPPPLLAETFTVGKNAAKQLEAQNKNGTLKNKVSELRDGSDGALELLKKNEGDAIEQRKTSLEDGNVGMFFHPLPDGDKVRVLAVYDMARFNQMVEKAQINTAASTVEEALASSSAKFALPAVLENMKAKSNAGSVVSR
jgi:predicted ABC-type ATPase